MPDDDQKPDAPNLPAASRAIWGSVAVGATYLLAIGGYLTYRGNLAPELQQMGLNEIGDFLSGVFAPLAFLGLFAAVIIQSRELAAQRRELQYTRLEFKANRIVLKQQVKASEKQSEYTDQQTAILSKQMDIASRRDMESVYNARYAMLIEILESLSGVLKLQTENTITHQFEDHDFIINNEPPFIAFRRFVNNVVQSFETSTLRYSPSAKQFLIAEHALSRAADLIPQTTAENKEKSEWQGVGFLALQSSLLSATIRDLQYAGP